MTCIAGTTLYFLISTLFCFYTHSEFLKTFEIFPGSYEQIEFLLPDLGNEVERIFAGLSIKFRLTGFAYRARGLQCGTHC